MTRDITRRALLMGAAGAVVVAGCKSLSAVNAVHLAGKGIGGAAGLVLNECGLSAAERTALVAVMTHVMEAAPGPSEKLAKAWMVAAKGRIDDLTSKGRLKPLTGAIALAAFAVVAYAYTLVEMRHPQVKVVREFATAAIDGLATGFLATFKPSGLSVQDYDVEAYTALRSYSCVMVLRGLTVAVARTQAQEER